MSQKSIFIVWVDYEASNALANLLEANFNISGTDCQTDRLSDDGNDFPSLMPTLGNKR